MTGSTAGFTLLQLQSAAARVHELIAPTPAYAWPKLGRRAGCTLWVKHENHTPTGAFKVRGGIIYMDRLRQAHPDVDGVISATRGNHGQSIAWSAARAGLQATIFVPLGNSPDQNASIAAIGADVIEFGRDFDEARREAHRVAQARGLHFVPSFHPDLVLGVASYALELFGAAPPLDAVYVGVGMGSGICGLIAARDALGLATDIVGVCAARAPATALSFAAGRPVGTATAFTFADGVATREPNAEAIDRICRGAARIVQVSEDEIADAMRAYYDDAHQVAEGAGAAPLAAVLKDAARLRGRRVAVVLSGGNIERARYLQVLAGQTPASGPP
jgi:threonine dehydratase